MATAATSSPRPIPPNNNQPPSTARSIAYKVNLAEEEDAGDYKPGGYHPVHIMDTFSNGRYLILRKMGWGHFSTVWLAKDNLQNRHVALKIMKSSRRYTETALDEIKLLRTVQTAKPSHPGYSHLVSFLDSFQHPGLHEQPHVCMTFEPLGENLLSLTQRCVKENKLLASTVTKRRHHPDSASQPHIDLAVPPAVVKTIARQILLGLSYLHQECKLIHTDLKPENILIALPDVEEVVRMELLAIPTSESIKCSTRTMIGVPAGYNRTKSPSSLHNNQVYIFSSQPLSSPSRTPLSSMASSLQNSPMDRLGIRMSALSMNTTTATKTSPPKRKAATYPLTAGSNVTTATTSPAHEDDSSPSSSSSSSNNTTPVTPNSDMPLSATPYNLTSPLGSYKVSGMSSSLGSMDVVMVPRLFKTADGKREWSNDGTVLPDHREGVTSQGREQTPVIGQHTHTPMTDSDGVTPVATTPTSAPAPSTTTGPSLLSRTAPKQMAAPNGGVRDDSSASTESGTPQPSLHVIEPVADQQLTPLAATFEEPLPPCPPLHVKIADMGNATPISKKFTNDIQTRQYRSPEAIMGMYEWDEKVDVFSVACLVFELLTGEYLFNPKSTARWSKDDDHVAQIMELMGDGFSNAMKTQGKYSREIFRSNGSLRNIRNLNFWPLSSVMMEKYDYTEEEAKSFASFMEPMLTIDPKKRASASSLVDHEWLKL